MGFFYFDESIQSAAGFIAGAWVYAHEDLTDHVHGALRTAGLEPPREEFKSGARMSTNPVQARARSALKGMIHELQLRLGTVVVPTASRSALGCEALKALGKFIKANRLTGTGHDVFVDAGVALEANSIQTFRADTMGTKCHVHTGQDSRIIGGIQIADLAAHTMGIMLLTHLGLLSKTVKAGAGSGYDPKLEIDLGFELWGGIRHSYFKGPQPIPRGDDPLGDLVFEVEPYGLHIAEGCSEPLRAAARERFGTFYMGCIH